ncbi:uncharacterized protein LOC129596511 [Paramacrobiotus metropolitanus]|uniref:uncharacterized protein LOC129596511 n=1 Tax=Paramacrobiotus metropolitanus TaxID=2943436 RepID=UPI002445E97B|nr:uncharacterized protein LOC129596511 [Paramacrobiotus metropolitanus]
MTTVSMPVRAVLVYLIHIEEHPEVIPEIAHYAHYMFLVNLHATYWSWLFLALHRLFNVFLQRAALCRQRKWLYVKVALSWMIPVAVNLPVHSRDDCCAASPWHAWCCRRECPLAFWLPFIGIYVPFALVALFYLLIILKVRKTKRELLQRVSLKRRRRVKIAPNAGNGIAGRVLLYFSFLMFYLIPSGIYSAVAEEQRSAALELFLSFIFTTPYVINTEIRQSVLTAWKRWHRRWLVHQSLIHTL